MGTSDYPGERAGLRTAAVALAATAAVAAVAALAAATLPRGQTGAGGPGAQPGGASGPTAAAPEAGTGAAEAWNPVTGDAPVRDAAYGDDPADVRGVPGDADMWAALVGDAGLSSTYTAAQLGALGRAAALALDERGLPCDRPLDTVAGPTPSSLNAEGDSELVYLRSDESGAYVEARHMTASDTWVASVLDHAVPGVNDAPLDRSAGGEVPVGDTGAVAALTSAEAAEGLAQALGEWCLANGVGTGYTAVLADSVEATEAGWSLRAYTFTAAGQVPTTSVVQAAYDAGAGAWSFAPAG